MNARDTITTDLNVLSRTSTRYLPAKYYKPCKYVMLGNLTPAIQMQCFKPTGWKSKAYIALDTMNFWMDIAMP